MKCLDLFSGIGGFALGFERSGIKTVAFCEKDSFCQKVLSHRWPDIPIYEDIRTLTAQQLHQDGIGTVDIVCGGFPCQDVSCAGKRIGIFGERSSLWFEMSRIIGEIRPRYVVLENVANLLFGGRGAWFGAVLGTLASLGYDAEWHIISAAAVGAPHIRERIWVIAYPDGLSREQEEFSNVEPDPARCVAFAHTDGQRSKGSTEESLQGEQVLKPQSLRAFTRELRFPDLPTSRVCRGDDGIRDRTYRLRALGNSVVPQIPEYIGRQIMNNSKKSSVDTLD